MKEGLRFVDSDMHVQEPGDIFEKYLDPAFKSRVTSGVRADGKLSGRSWIIDGLAASMDVELQQHRKKPASSRASGPILGSATGPSRAARDSSRCGSCRGRAVSSVARGHCLQGASRKRMPSEQMQQSICSCRESLGPSSRSAAPLSLPATSGSRASR